MRMGIGIGWPNNTSRGESNLRSGWFVIDEVCLYGVIPSAFTEFVENVDWQSGNYVYSPYFGTRALLGAFTDEEPSIGSNLYPVIGPVYNACFD
jgi:hypothetical protein